jgi:hypothetical protein
MITKISLRAFNLIPVMLTLLGCAANSGTGPTSFEPLPLTEENFYSLVNAELMSRSEANQLVAMAECADLGRMEVAGESLHGSVGAVEELIRQFQPALARSGSNIYVLESSEWQQPPENPGTVRLVLQVRGLICDL